MAGRWRRVQQLLACACCCHHWTRGSAAPPTVPDDFWPAAPPSPRVTPRAGAPRPHIILHVTDDQGWANVGYHNEGHVLTPTMDRLATKEGVRLERHYAFQWCAPSRAALLTGRESYHVLAQGGGGGDLPAAVTRGMTMLPKKLQSVGYTTHQIGKWHLGMAMEWQTPYSRGFNTSFGYLGGGEDHYTQAGMQQEWGCFGTDLWNTRGPAYGTNGTYAAYLYNSEALRIIKEHPEPEVNPLFVYLATQTMHAPVQVPSYWSDMYRSDTYTKTYAVSNGMATVTDSILGNVSLALQQRRMWNHTLIVHLSDNGGPVWKHMASHANNFPLRGGKHCNFEGGVRVVAFVSGGFLPARRHGLVLDGIIHNADWWPTFAVLAGASPHDPPAQGVTGVPGVDGYDMWPYITGAVASSPRSEVVLDSTPSGGIISGDMKLILGTQRFGFWQGPIYPNSSGPALGTPVLCGKGCLFNVTADMSEYHDLATERPDEVARLTALFQARIATKYVPPQTAKVAVACSEKVTELRGYLGPYIQFGPPSPPPPPPPPPPPVFRLQRGNDCLAVRHDGGAQVVVAVACASKGAASLEETSSVARSTPVQDWVTDASAGGYLAAVDGASSKATNRSYSFIKMDEHPDSENKSLPQFCKRGRAYMCGWSEDVAGKKCLGPAGSMIHQGFLVNLTDGTMRSSRCKSPQWQCLRVPPSKDGAAGERAVMGQCDGAGEWHKVPQPSR